MKVTLCKASDIEDPGSRGFELESGDRTVELFVVHKWGEYHAYINSCPHRGTNLDWQEHQFLDRDKEFIQCSTHDALFEIPTGLCISGPCVGGHLTPLALEQSDGQLLVELD